MAQTIKISETVEECIEAVALYFADLGYSVRTHEDQMEDFVLIAKGVDPWVHVEGRYVVRVSNVENDTGPCVVLHVHGPDGVGTFLGYEGLYDPKSFQTIEKLAKRFLDG